MQYPALLKLCKMIKERTNKTIWLWTGYEMPYLEIFYGDLLKYVDVVVDGPFKKELAKPGLKWRGSTNQRVLKISYSTDNGAMKIDNISDI